MTTRNMIDVLTLSTELTRQIMQDWLSLRCLVRTYAAFRGSKQENFWSNVVSSGLGVCAPLIIEDIKTFNACEKLTRWIIDHRIQLSVILATAAPKAIRAATRGTSNFADIFTIAGAHMLRYEGKLLAEECTAISMHCPNLSELRIADPAIPSTEEILQKCTKLTTLRLGDGFQNTQISPWNQLYSIHLPMLEDIELNFITFPDPLQDLCTTCPNLKRLILDAQFRREGAIADFEEIARCLPRLERLILYCYDEEDFSDADLLSFVYHCPHLREVGVYGSTILTDKSLVPLAERLRLTFLALDNVNDRCLQALAQHCATSLQELELYAGREESSLMHLVQVAERCTNLKSLTLTKWGQNNSLLWSQVVANLHNIATVFMGDSGFSVESALVMARNCPKLKTFTASNIATSLRADYFHAGALLALLRGCPLLESVWLDKEVDDLCSRQIAEGSLGDPSLGLAPWSTAELERAKRFLRS